MSASPCCSVCFLDEIVDASAYRHQANKHVQICGDMGNMLNPAILVF